MQEAYGGQPASHCALPRPRPQAQVQMLHVQAGKRAHTLAAHRAQPSTSNSQRARPGDAAGAAAEMAVRGPPPTKVTLGPSPGRLSFVPPPPHTHPA